MTKKPFLLLIFTLLAASAVPIVTLSASGCGETAAAGELVDAGEVLRQSATDRFRRQTAVMDALVGRVSGGGSLALATVEQEADTAVREYDAAVAELEERAGKLDEAAALELDETYRDYLRLLSDSNDRMIEALRAAAEIPALMLANEQVFAGWDEIRLGELLDEIGATQRRVSETFGEAETLRAEAEKLREDNPESF